MNMLRLRKGEERLFWIPHNITETVCFLAIVRQSNIAFSVVHVHVCFQSILFIILFPSCGQLSSELVYNICCW